jgi:uncharacterized protein with FMN-binding domain
MNQSHNTNTPKIVGTIIVSAVLLIGIYTLIISRPGSATLAASNTVQTTQLASATEAPASTQTPQPTPVASTDTSSTSTNTAVPTTTAYKDGTYTKTSKYRVPGGGVNQLSATIILKDGSISSVTTTNKYDERESRMYVTSFSSNIKNVVTGQKITSSYVGRVGGASLTSGAFNDIIDAVMNDAKA